MPRPDPVPHRILRVYPDYDDAPLLTGVDLMHGLTPADLGLSRELTERIDAWHARFQSDHLDGHDWRSADSAAAYEREGRAVVDGLVAELPGYVVRYSLWPVGDGGGYAGGWEPGWSPSGETPCPRAPRPGSSTSRGNAGSG